MLSLLAAAALVVPQGEIWTVAADGTGDFLEIQPAVDAAADGDVVHVRDHPDDQGTYSPFVVDGKGLSVVAFPGGRWAVEGCVVANVPADGTVLLRGLGIHRQDPGIWRDHCYSSHIGGPGSTGLEILGCDGVVHVDRCTIDGEEGKGIDVVGCRAVVLSRSRVEGDLDGLYARIGLRVAGSNVLVHESELIGSNGWGGSCGAFCTWCTGGTDGAPAVEVLQQSSFHATSCQIVGGDGGACGSCFFCDGNGASGLVVDSTSTAFVRDCEIVSGHWGFPGPPIVGAVTESTETPRTLEIAMDVGAETLAPFAVRGEPGERVYLLVSPTTDFVPYDDEVGRLLVGEPIPGGRRAAGFLDASGRLQGEAALPAPPSGESTDYAVQAALVSPSGVRFTNARVVTKLGADAPVLAADEVVHVDATAPPGGTGRSWSTALGSLHEATRRTWGRAGRPCEIWLREGVYDPGELARGTDSRFRLPTSTIVRGGFDGTETSPDQRDTAAHPTIVTGDLFGDDDQPGGGTDDNANVLLLWGDRLDRCSPWPAVLDGVIVEGGHARGEPFEAALSFEIDLKLVDCVLRDNHYEDAAVVRAERLTCDRTAWIANEGRLWLDDALVVAEDSQFVGNVATGPLGYLNRYLDTRVVGCAFVANSVGAPYGALERRASRWSSPTVVRNTIAWANTSGGVRDEAAQVHLTDYDGDKYAIIGWTCVDGWTGALGGEGNHGLDPLFVDPLGPDGIPGTGDEDLRLGPYSPCVDAGDNEALGPGDVVDLDGEPRRADDPDVPDTGRGTPPVVDMGPYERQ